MLWKKVQAFRINGQNFIYLHCADDAVCVNDTVKQLQEVVNEV